MYIDHHFYFDKNYYNLDELNLIFKKNKIYKGIISPPCTVGTEPEKAEYMYLIQRKLINNPIGYELCKLVSKSFYDSKDELRTIWKLFSKNQNLNKVIEPDNEMIFNLIKNLNFLTMWYWINPKTKSLKDHIININKYKTKLAGIKFHQYWHNFELNDLLKFQEILFKEKLPIYVLLNYENEKNIFNFLENFKNIKILIGYAGFPNFKKLWKLIKNRENVFVDIASNHIDQQIIKNLINSIDLNRIIFSSDFPYNFKNNKNEFEYSQLYQRLNFLNNLDKQKVLNNKL